MCRRASERTAASASITGRWARGSSCRCSACGEPAGWGAGGATTDSTGTGGYEALDRAVAEFFHTGKAPVAPEETLELFEFMSAAQVSHEKGGAEVPLASLRK